MVNDATKKTSRLRIIATGKQYTVKEFINLSKKLGMKIVWRGSKLREKAFFNDESIIEIDKKYFRPTEVDSLKGTKRPEKTQMETQI